MDTKGEAAYVPALRFHWLTPFYDTVVRLTTRERTFKRALIGQAEIEAGHCVLDLGCGTGSLSVWAKRAHPDADVVGVDGDPAVLARAARRALQAGTTVRFDRAMSYELPYPNASFDRVLSTLFFHHLPRRDKVRTLREVRRVLKPMGELHVADWGQAENRVMRALFVLVRLLDGFANTRDNVDGRLPALMEEAGLVTVVPRRTYSTMFGTMALYSGVRGEERLAARDSATTPMRGVVDRDADDSPA